MQASGWELTNHACPGCRSCSRRRINCDRTQPRCRKCVRDNLECYGFDGSYRWITASSTPRPRSIARSSRASTGHRVERVGSFLLLKLANVIIAERAPGTRHCHRTTGSDRLANICSDTGTFNPVPGPLGCQLLYVRTTIFSPLEHAP